ncbi:MAG: GlpG protein [Planctomycetaceae bacterium]
MAKILAMDLAREVDLLRFTLFLKQAGIAHLVHESGERQLLWVDTMDQKNAVLKAFEHYERGELPVVSTRPNPKLLSAVLAKVLYSPFTLTLILANVLCFPATLGVADGTLSPWLKELTLLDFYELDGRLYFADLAYTLETGQFWRFITPMLLHFGWLHIVFNLLWVWEIGRRIEAVNGATWLLALVLLSSISANLTQYFLSGAGLFGGMSGVVFGLLGFAFVWSRVLPEKTLGLPPGIYIFMLVFLVIGFTGAFDLLGLGSLANGAHLGGLIGGVLVGLIAVFSNRVINR